MEHTWEEIRTACKQEVEFYKTDIDPNRGGEYFQDFYFIDAVLSMLLRATEYIAEAQEEPDAMCDFLERGKADVSAQFMQLVSKPDYPFRVLDNRQLINQVEHEYLHTLLFEMHKVFVVAVEENNHPTKSALLYLRGQTAIEAFGLVSTASLAIARAYIHFMGQEATDNLEVELKRIIAETEAKSASDVERVIVEHSHEGNAPTIAYVLAEFLALHNLHQMDCDVFDAVMLRVETELELAPNGGVE